MGQPWKIKVNEFKNSVQSFRQRIAGMVSASTTHAVLRKEKIVASVIHLNKSAAALEKRFHKLSIFTK